ncbi:OmpH family outer membrane protein [Fontisphaera persica]|uniref:OmpH family outer membrane protein n=1 Tax=Fontisphaera persica TaxID=2974023 RepID=UPI0024C00477|nr:OmpH family outer membrane protein [Fontisphaera persica]WCJ59817.1 OmpH family outer membrane protein [Fontisphaera persica]
MTRTTTAADRRTVLISWIVALLVLGGGTLWLALMPAQPVKKLPPTETKRRLQQPPASRPPKPLPEQFVLDLVKQAEILTKQELQQRLQKFEQMSVDMSQRKLQLLNKIEARPLLSHSPTNANDTSMAREGSFTNYPPLGADPSVEALYQRLAQYESQIQNDYIHVKAAEWALQRGQSFPEVLLSMQPPSTLMPPFEALISRQTGGTDWRRSPDSPASAGLVIANVEDLKNYRGVLGLASLESGLAESRLDSLFSSSRRGRPPPPGFSGATGGTRGPPMEYAPYEAKLDPEMVKAQALPGRRFSRSSERRGWLYINTWYMIGPWDGFGRTDFSIPHPPELAVDLDATYTDGLIGRGIEETESDPLKVKGNVVMLDGTLRWKFMQSESMHNTVPVTVDGGVYYAYTELYFDEPAIMLVALGTDDAGKIWINGQEIWKDVKPSWYHIDEHLVTFQFQQGWNRILVRLENTGGAATGFSFLICPKDAATLSKTSKSP